MDQVNYGLVIILVGVVIILLTLFSKAAKEWSGSPGQRSAGGTDL